MRRLGGFGCVLEATRLRFLIVILTIKIESRRSPAAGPATLPNAHPTPRVYPLDTRRSVATVADSPHLI
jgi:hypothetical protein